MHGTFKSLSHACAFQNHAVEEVSPCTQALATRIEVVVGGLPCRRGYQEILDTPPPPSGPQQPSCDISDHGFVTVCHPNNSVQFTVFSPTYSVQFTVFGPPTYSQSTNLKSRFCPESPISNHGLSPCAILKSQFVRKCMLRQVRKGVQKGCRGFPGKRCCNAQVKFATKLHLKNEGGCLLLMQGKQARIAPRDLQNSYFHPHYAKVSNHGLQNTVCVS